MTADFSSLYNHHEREVFAAVLDASKDFPDIAGSNDLLCDVACVALNRLPPRYIRHEVDFSFYLTEHERVEIDNAIAEAVSYAFSFVQARTAMRARK
jgi:hypothetical protein